MKAGHEALGGSAGDLPELPRPLMGHGYRLVKKLGEGAVGEVFEAEHCSLGHAVAVKVLQPDLLSRARTRQRFQSEARALARIDSEYVVRVLDYGTLDDGRPFTVMELLKGVDMRALLAYEHRVSIARGVRLVQDACRGLAAAHAAGFIHRDLKPENLFVARRPDGNERCKVIDFGVAREVNASPVTAEGTLVGTTRYMTPEQVRGQKVTVRVDVYALGAILFELLVGTPMVQGQNENIILFRICNEPAPFAQPFAHDNSCPSNVPVCANAQSEAAEGALLQHRVSWHVICRGGGHEALPLACRPSVHARGMHRRKRVCTRAGNRPTGRWRRWRR